MRVGILGSGLMGAKLGTLFARAWHEVVFMLAHYGWPDIPSHSRCSSPNSRMAVKEDRNWHTGSSDLGNRTTK